MLLNKLVIKNEKGFNLFTALVSLLLISISLILIFNMIRTEESYLKLLQDQSETSDLITIADLARADAYNRFIVGLRVQWEKYMSSPSNVISLSRDQLDLNWPTFVNKTAVDYFFERNFTSFLASSIVTQLNYTENPAGYSVRCYTNVNHEDNTDTALFGSILTQAFDDADNRVDVVNCDQDYEDECIGSFYFTLDTRMLSDENYEKLPIVFVKDIKTQAVIEKPILGRQVYKIYMPWRGFQALRTARRIAFSPEREMSDNPIVYTAENDNGLFNPLFHNILEQARLGICDPYTCAPRTCFFSTPSYDGFGESCSEGPGKISFEECSFSSNDIDISDHLDYTIDETKDAFQDLIGTTVEKNLTRRIIEENETLNYRLDKEGNATGLVMICKDSDNNYCDCILENDNSSNESLPSICIDVSIDQTPTKKVSDSPAPSPFDLPSIKSISQYFVSSTSPTITNVAEGAGGPGLFLDNGFPYLGHIHWHDLWNNAYDGVSQDANNAFLKCSELRQITYYLVFEERNNKYKISENPIYIYVNLNDVYTPFTYIPNLDELASEDPSNYLVVNNEPDFSYDPSIDNISAWHCSTYEVGAEGSGNICIPSSN